MGQGTRNKGYFNVGQTGDGEQGSLGTSADDLASRNQSYLLNHLLASWCGQPVDFLVFPETGFVYYYRTRRGHVRRRYRCVRPRSWRTVAEQISQVSEKGHNIQWIIASPISRFFSCFFFLL